MLFYKLMIIFANVSQYVKDLQKTMLKNILGFMLIYMARKKNKYDDKKLRGVFPNWLIILYAAACGFLIPWIYYIDSFLPRRYITTHWDLAWAGFDIFLCSLFAITAFLAIKKSSWTAFTATILGTVIIIDTWFDVLTSYPGRDHKIAVLEAIFIEIPIALISYTLAIRVFKSKSHK